MYFLFLFKKSKLQAEARWLDRTIYAHVNYRFFWSWPTLIVLILGQHDTQTAHANARERANMSQIQFTTNYQHVSSEQPSN